MARASTCRIAATRLRSPRRDAIIVEWSLSLTAEGSGRRKAETEYILSVVNAQSSGVLQLMPRRWRVADLVTGGMRVGETHLAEAWPPPLTFAS